MDSFSGQTTCQNQLNSQPTWQKEGKSQPTWQKDVKVPAYLAKGQQESQPTWQKDYKSQSPQKHAYNFNSHTQFTVILKNGKLLVKTNRGHTATT